MIVLKMKTVKYRRPTPTQDSQMAQNIACVRHLMLVLQAYLQRVCGMVQVTISLTRATSTLAMMITSTSQTRHPAVEEELALEVIMRDASA
jgi:hypothetical protein